MDKINTIEIESAFNDLIAELEKIKDLNSIASSLRDSAVENQEITDKLCSALTIYYEHAMSIEKNLAEYHQTIVNDIVSTKNEFDTEMHKITDLQEEINNRITKNEKKNLFLFAIILLVNIISISLFALFK